MALLSAFISAAGSTSAWGVTLDNDAGISRTALAAQTRALAALPARPWARVVADVDTQPSDFARSLPAVHRVARTILELGDSSEVHGAPTARYAAWVRSFTTRYARQVDVWEIGNEVNGEWVGSPAAELARVRAAYAAVHAAGGRTMLTLYYNPNCWSKQSNELFTWLAAHDLSGMRLDYVTISYYPGDCNGYWPSPAVWQSVFDRLHARFPHARLGFGEAGVSSKSAATAARIALWKHYVAVRVRGDNYVGLGLWWTWAEDAVPMSKPFWHGFAATLH